nr:hypothetical protein [Streptomyces sp. NRRL S-337]
MEFTEFMDGQDPGTPVRSGVLEHGPIPEYYAAKVDIAALLAELEEGEVLAGGARHGRRRAQAPGPASTSCGRC